MNNEKLTHPVKESSGSGKPEVTIEGMQDLFNRKDYDSILRTARATDNFKDMDERLIGIKNDVLNSFKQKIESAKQAYEAELEADPRMSDSEKKDLWLRHSAVTSNILEVLQGADNYDPRVVEVREIAERAWST